MSAPKYRLTSAEIALILGQKRWFTDPDPTWDKARTHADTVVLATRWIKRLRRNSQDNPVTPERLALAALMEKCGPGHRCGLGCCPRCGRAFQRWAVSLILRRMAEAL